MRGSLEYACEVCGYEWEVYGYDLDGDSHICPECARRLGVEQALAEAQARIKALVAEAKETDSEHIEAHSLVLDRAEKAEAERDQWQQLAETSKNNAILLLRERDAALANNAAFLDRVSEIPHAMAVSLANEPHPGADLLAEVEALRAVAEAAYNANGRDWGDINRALAALDALRGAKIDRLLGQFEGSGEYDFESDPSCSRLHGGKGDA